MAADIRVDQELCIGCGLCVSIVPEIFRLNAARVAEVQAGCEFYEGRMQEAMESCPVNCMYRR
jgi:ferredoxin